MRNFVLFIAIFVMASCVCGFVFQDGTPVEGVPSAGDEAPPAEDAGAGQKLIYGAIGGILLALTGFFKNKDEQFDLKKMLITVVTGAVSGILTHFGTALPPEIMTTIGAAGGAVILQNLIQGSARKGDAMWKSLKGEGSEKAGKKG